MNKMKLIYMLLILILSVGSISFTGIAESSTSQAGTEAYEPGAGEISLGGRVVGDEPTHVTVGNATKVNGAFFTSQFGNNTSDIDVRAMIHGYNPIVWETQLTFIYDESVVADYSQTYNSDGDTVYTISIADDLTWNNGLEITAADYVFSYLLQASPEFSELGADTDIWKHVSGYEAYNSQNARVLWNDLYDVDVFKGVHLISKYTFSITVSKEYLPYFYELSFLSITPCPITVIAPGCEVRDEGNGAFIKNIDDEITERIFSTEILRETILDPANGYLSNPTVTCGPYNLISYNRETGTVEFHKNDYYKGNYEGVRPAITDVTLVPVLPEDMVRELQDEDVDILNKVVDGPIIRELMQLTNGVIPDSYLESIALSDGDNGVVTKATDSIDVRNVDMANYARLGYGYFGLACESGPQQFVNVRRALACAFDSEEYVRSFLMGFGLTVKGYYGIGQWMTQAAIGNLRLKEMTPEEEAIWDSFSLDELDDYDFNMDRALRFLIEDGWNLNEKGEPFNAEIDDIRYKRIDETTLMPFTFTIGLTENNTAANQALEMLETGIEQLNGSFTVVTAPYSEILEDHLRDAGERRFDIIFMATNFVSIFDPLKSMEANNSESGSQNVSSVYDEELLELAQKLHETEPMNVQKFEENWIEFQARYNEILPTLPIYSNVYFDFYGNHLHNYNIGSETNWPTAILYAWWSDEDEIVETVDGTDETAVTETTTNEIIID